MAQAAARLEVPHVHVANRLDGGRKRRRGLATWLTAAMERDRQRRQLSGFGTTQELGRSSGIRG